MTRPYQLPRRRLFLVNVKTISPLRKAFKTKIWAENAQDAVEIATIRSQTVPGFIDHEDVKQVSWNQADVA